MEGEDTFLHRCVTTDTSDLSDSPLPLLPPVLHGAVPLAPFPVFIASIQDAHIVAA